MQVINYFLLNCNVLISALLNKNARIKLPTSSDDKYLHLVSAFNSIQVKCLVKFVFNTFKFV